MSTLSAAEIARHAHAAGFRGDDLNIAVAVALAESNGNTRAHNGTPPDNSYGLWQINMLGSLGPARRREFGIDSNRELFDPEENAKAAKRVYDDAGGSWGPWSTFTNGAYKQHLDKARRATESLDRDKPEDGRQGGSQRPGRDSAASLIGNGKKGFRVDPEALNAYAKEGHRVADQLDTLAKRHLGGLTHTAANGFGKVGAESGFAQALEGFGGALRHQVKALGNRTDALATATRRVSKEYREREDDTRADMNGARSGGSFA